MYGGAESEEASRGGRVRWLALQGPADSERGFSNQNVLHGCEYTDVAIFLALPRWLPKRCRCGKPASWDLGQNLVQTSVPGLRSCTLIYRARDVKQSQSLLNHNPATRCSQLVAVAAQFYL